MRCRKTIHRRKIYLLGAGIVFIAAAVAWSKSGIGREVRETIPLNEVEAGKDAVRVVYNDVAVYLRHVEGDTGGTENDIRYEDGTKVPMEWAEERGECEPMDERLEGIHFKVYKKDGIKYVQFRCQDIVFRFTDSLGTEKFEYVTNYGKVDKLQDAQKAFGGWESIFTGRGYIWSRILSLIRQFPVLGTGPDTFMVVFPQNDYVARARLGTNFFKEILTNGHSLYLNMALETGIPSLLCFLVFVGWYLICSWKTYYGKKSSDTLERTGLGIFLGVFGYLICGFTWASNICVASVFWMLLGMGIALIEKAGYKSGDS